LQYPKGETAESLGLDGTETFTITGVEKLNEGSTPPTVKVSTDSGVSFDAVVRIDTPGEAEYYRHGGILQYVLRKMLAAPPPR
jgi:aconitate hydratase